MSYADNAFIVSGGCSSPTGIHISAGGIEKAVIGQPAELINTSEMIKTDGYLSYSSGVLADGTVILTGPVSADGTADTYLLNQDGTLSLFDKRANSGNVMMPASLAYNGNY